MEQKKYCGTYNIRNVGKGENAIHMPSYLSGAYSIYLSEKDGIVTLVPQGGRS